MRKHYAVLTGAAVLAIGALVLPAGADIEGSAHDFSGEGWSKGEICLPCHTPHNSQPVALNPDGSPAAPLWNHELTVSTYTTYENGAGTARDDALDARSILCMSCHDGTVALDSFGGNTGVQFITGHAKLGTDLTNDHPIGADAIYPDVPYFNDPANWENTAGHGFTLRDMEIDSKIERVVSCTTCHEPHNRNGFEHMLWVNNSKSALCLTCHLK